jgi:hypothetical protein
LLSFEFTLGYISSASKYEESKRLSGSPASGDGSLSDVKGLNISFDFDVPSTMYRYENLGILDVSYKTIKGDTSFTQEIKSVNSDKINHKIEDFSVLWIPYREYHVYLNSSLVFGFGNISWNRTVSDGTFYEKKHLQFLYALLGYEVLYEPMLGFNIGLRGLYKMALTPNVDVKTNSIDGSYDLGFTQAYAIEVPIRFDVSYNVFIEAFIGYERLIADNSTLDADNSYQESKASLSMMNAMISFGFKF